MSRRWVAVLSGVLVAALVGCSGETQPAGASRSAATSARAFDPTDFVTLQSRWWTWAASAPRETNPISDTTGAQCANDQPEDVWFLAGSFGGAVERRCQVPAGRPLAGPAINLMSDDRNDCVEFMSQAEGEVTLDGAPAASRRMDPFEVTVQAKPGNAVTSRSGRLDVQSCGIWFTIPSLSPGEHVIVIRGFSSTFSVETTYHLTVLPPV